jgi:hypothetical protein
MAEIYLRQGRLSSDVHIWRHKTSHQDLSAITTARYGRVETRVPAHAPQFISGRDVCPQTSIAGGTKHPIKTFPL